MNFLQTAVLSAIAIGSVSASTDQAGFRAAVDNDNLETAATLWKQNMQLCSREIDYVIEKKPPGFLVDFIKAAGEENKLTLARVYEKTSEATKKALVTFEKASEVIKEVLDGIYFTDNDLAEVAPKHELTCVPNHFLDLVGRIKTPIIQEQAVSNGISKLFPRRTDCVNPLLAALEGSTSLSKGVKDTAIQAVFEWAAFYNIDAWIVRFSDHPAITSKVYGRALSSSWSIHDDESKVFPVLLEQANRDDLKAAMDSVHYIVAHPEARAAIKEALPKAKAGGTRIHK
jgi:hypothetical protein